MSPAMTPDTRPDVTALVERFDEFVEAYARDAGEYGGNLESAHVQRKGWDVLFADLRVVLAAAALAASPAPAPTTPPWLATKSDAISVIELHHAEENCYICDRVARLGFGVPVYESEILPDDDRGEWGGQHVCASCYLLVRGILAEWPGHRVPTSFVRRLAAPSDDGGPR